MNNLFPVLLLNARPAAGKSEILHYLHHVDRAARIRRFHIGNIVEIDDFPMLWSWFEEDAILEEMGFHRLHTDTNGYFNHHGLWNLLIRKICLEYEKLLRDRRDLHENTTVIIEFSRGCEHGGYAEAYKHLSQAVISRASILYVDVSYEESLRKNRRRFNPERPDSILEHGLPDEKLERLYRDTDWHELAETGKERITVGTARVPFAVFDNSADITTAGGEPLGLALENSFSRLWEIYSGA
ncbi:MAG: hypothetical protein JW852_09915 [Spirochaetales bacterium]|nr:hypothetical protein [Spirochaetales bacterium]